MRADCTAISVNQAATDELRIQLQCQAEIKDVYRLVQPILHFCTVTYSIGKENVEELSIQGYPFSSRDEPRPRPSSAEQAHLLAGVFAVKGSEITAVESAL